MSQESKQDRDVIRKVLGGQSEAFETLVRRHQAPLFAFIGKFLPQSTDREDIAQEAFLRAFLNLSTWDNAKGTFAAWLIRIARNGALNALKKMRPVTLADFPEPATERASEPEAYVALDRALLRLPVDQRSAFLLVEVHGFTCAEAAEIEGVPPGTVKSRMSRAREKLRAALSEEVRR